MPFLSFVSAFTENVVKPAVAARFDETGKAWKAMAVAEVPEDTGYLKSTIGYSVGDTGLTLNLYADAPYAALVEFGTSRTPAQPFMRPALAAIPRVFRGQAALQFANLAEPYQEKTVAHAASKAGGRVRVKAGKGKFR